MMNQLKYGTISHQGLRYNNPFSVAKIEEVIELLVLNDQASVLDIGSGKAELLIRLIERYQVRALGLELFRMRSNKLLSVFPTKGSNCAFVMQ